MSLEERIKADLKTALLAHDSLRVDVFRLLTSELKNAQIAKGAPLTEDEQMKVIRKEVKKRQEAATAYAQAGQSERAEHETTEAETLTQYLPAPADQAAIETYIRSQLAGRTSLAPAERGALIRDTLAHFQGTADGKLVATLVAELTA